GAAKSCGCPPACQPECCKPVITKPCCPNVYTYQRACSTLKPPCCDTCCAPAECCAPANVCAPTCAPAQTCTPACCPSNGKKHGGLFDGMRGWFGGKNKKGADCCAPADCCPPG